jgi:hypothetical protein
VPLPSVEGCGPCDHHRDHLNRDDDEDDGQATTATTTHLDDDDDDGYHASTSAETTTTTRPSCHGHHQATPRNNANDIPKQRR